ncbi:MAG: chemotaxis protein CheX [Gammaproteobacteria bacterium]|nr:chemotaxis protein CheX [Gammaproteobacteria bacterium]
MNVDNEDVNRANDGNKKIASKLLIIESESNKQEKLRDFCLSNNLKGVLVPEQDKIKEALENNLNIGAIVIPDIEAYTRDSLHDILRDYHSIPLFIGSDPTKSQEWNFLETAIVEYYDTNDLNSLNELLSLHVFNSLYPDGMIEVLKDIGLGAINSLFKNVNTIMREPYLSSDKRIFGERIEMMPIRSNWCDGIMMLQSEGSGVEKLIMSNHTSYKADKELLSSYTEDLLRELTNHIWGGFKEKFMPDGFSGRTNSIEVPMTINHQEKYISFGIRKPLLCLKFIVSDVDANNPDFKPISLYLKFSFHLYWNTDEYVKNEKSEDDIEAGGLDLF